MTAAFFTELFKALIAAVAPKMGSLARWLISKALGFGGQSIVDYYKKKAADKKRDKEQKAALDKMNKVKNDPNATREDKIKAEQDFLNS